MKTQIEMMIESKAHDIARTFIPSDYNDLVETKAEYIAAALQQFYDIGLRGRVRIRFPLNQGRDDASLSAIEALEYACSIDSDARRRAWVSAFIAGEAWAFRDLDAWTDFR